MTLKSQQRPNDLGTPNSTNPRLPFLQLQCTVLSQGSLTFREKAYDDSKENYLVWSPAINYFIDGKQNAEF